MQFKNGFEAGANNTAITAANSGGGTDNAFGVFGAGAKFSNVRAHSGSLSCEFTDSATATYGAISYGAETLIAMRGSYWFTNPNSGGEFNLAGLYDAAGNSIAIFRLTATNVLRLYVSGGGGSNAWAPSTTMPTGQWVRFELLVEQGTTATGGRMRAAIFANNATTPLADSGWLENVNLGGGTVAITRTRFGKGAPNSNASGVFMDDLLMHTGADYASFPTSIGNEPPSVSAGGDQTVAGGSTVLLAGTASDPGGSVASTAWSFVAAESTGTPTLSGGNTLTPSFVAGAAPQLYTLQLTATDNLGASSTDTVEIRVPASGAADARPLPFAATKSGAWTRNGGTSDGAALADESNTTYLESDAVSGAEQSIRFRLAPSTARATGKVQVTLGMDSGVGNWQIRLFEGTTLRQAWTQAGVPATPTAYEFTLLPATISAITDWSNLSLELGVTS
ncbi:hypothetical protein [Microbacterium sp. NPDC078849]|uniref:PKD domain-containing protein n=1 Tax=unclassified Microbacterium TaxID=2609290 RepID=UPI00344C0BE9